MGLVAAVSAHQTLIVFVAALITALATGLGALPFVGRRPRVGGRTLGTANAVAAGVMIGASIALFVQGSDRSAWKLAIGVVVGVLFLIGVGKVLGQGEHHSFGEMRGADARKALLIVIAMTVHSAAEGVGVGAGFGDGDKLGWLLTVAIAIHNIPEGLAISLVLVPRGASVLKASLWSVFTSLPQPLLAVPAFLFVEHFTGLVPVGLGFAGGAMVWLAARELLPEALEMAPARTVIPVGIAAAAAMIAFQLFAL